MLTSSRKKQEKSRGVSLVEALIALLVVAVGVVALQKFQSSSRLNSDVGRQRTEALKLAQNDIEQLRSAVSAADIQSTNRTVAADASNAANTTFQVEREVTSGAGASRTVQVTVSWLDRSGAAQQVAISSVISVQPSALTGALAVAHRSADALPLTGRSADIPAVAHDLGDGRSVLKLDSTQTDVYVFDNRNGRVTSTCSGVQRHTRHVVVGDLTSCTSIAAVLLSGQVRFSLTAPPDAARPTDAPLALAIALTLSGGPYLRPAICGAEAMKTVNYLEGGQQRRAAVPLNATPASWAVANWVELSERFTAIHCVVVGKGTPAHWSGRLSIAPRGWALGSSASKFKVCRYTAQSPEVYVEVSTSISEQNFLVIRGDQLCPSASAFSGNGEGVQNFADLATTAHAQ